MVASGLILLHVRGFLRKPAEASDIYFLEAVGDETVVRSRAAKALRDVRSLGEVVPPQLHPCRQLVAPLPSSSPTVSSPGTPVPGRRWFREVERERVR